MSSEDRNGCGSGRHRRGHRECAADRLADLRFRRVGERSVDGALMLNEFQRRRVDRRNRGFECVLHALDDGSR
jgi:hypothetical protein